MTSVADNRDRGLDVEDESCSQWSLKPIADDRGRRERLEPVVVWEYSGGGIAVRASQPGQGTRCGGEATRGSGANTVRYE